MSDPRIARPVRPGPEVRSALRRIVRPVRRMETSPLEVAFQFSGTEEVVGGRSNPWILAWIQDVMPWSTSDEDAWCSAFAYAVAGRILGLQVPKTPRARTWLCAGTAVSLSDAKPGSDIVILKRGGENQPGPEVRSAPGHVAFFMAIEDDHVVVCGGNQTDMVCVARFPVTQVLGVRRLY